MRRKAIKVSEEIHAIIARNAKLEHRSMSNYVESLVLADDAKR